MADVHPRRSRRRSQRNYYHEKTEDVMGTSEKFTRSRRSDDVMVTSERFTRSRRSHLRDLPMTSTPQVRPRRSLHHSATAAVYRTTSPRKSRHRPLATMRIRTSKSTSGFATSVADDEGNDDGASAFTSISGMSAISGCAGAGNESSMTSDDDLEKSYRSRFSRLQRQVLSSDIAKMNQKMDQMRGKDAQLKKKFMELQQKRLLLDLDLADLTTGEQSTKTQDESFSIPPLGGTTGLVPGFNPGGATETQAAPSPPIPPPRRRGRTPKVKKIRGGGRTEPYPTPEKGKMIPQRVLAAVSPMRSSNNSGKSAKVRTPSQELAELTRTLVLRSATKQRAPLRPNSHSPDNTHTPGILSIPPPTSLQDKHSLLRSVSSDPGSVTSLDALRHARDVSSASRSHLAAETSSSSCDVSSVHNVTEWSMFDVSYKQGKDKVKKKTGDENRKQKRGLRRNKSGNKIFPTDSLTAGVRKETSV